MAHLRALALGLAAVAICQPAVAQEWSARVGGYFKGGVGYIDADQSGNDLGLVREAEIHFRFQSVADNGLTFGTYFELDVADASSDGSSSFDEANLFVSGDFGRIEIGEQDGAGDQLTLTPAGCSVSCSAEVDGFLFDWYSDDTNLNLINDGADSSDDLKVTYLTPTLGAGAFTARAGISWAPTTEDNGVATSLDASKEENFIELGLRGGVDLSGIIGHEADLGFSGAFFDGDSFDDPSYVFASNLSARGVGLGARYSYRNPNGEEEDSLSVGAQYEGGPWGFFANYTTILDSTVRTEDDWGVNFEVDYRLAPGVTAAGIVEFGDATGAGESAAVGGVLYLNF